MWFNKSQIEAALNQNDYYSIQPRDNILRNRILQDWMEMNKRIEELEATVQMKLDDNPPIFTAEEWKSLSAWQRLRINSIYFLASKAINDLKNSEENRGKKFEF